MKRKLISILLSTIIILPIFTSTSLAYTEENPVYAFTLSTSNEQDKLDKLQRELDEAELEYNEKRDKIISKIRKIEEKMEKRDRRRRAFKSLIGY